MSESKQIATVETVSVALERMAPQFALTLPEHIPVERFNRVVSTAVQQSPELLDADRKSLFLACQQAAQDGLLPDGKEGALVIFNNKIKGQDGEKDQWKKTVRWMPMVRGILTKLRQSGQVKMPHVDVVYEKDSFRQWADDDGPHIVHEPVSFGDRGQPLGAYAIAKLNTGEAVVEVMAKADILAVKNVSKAKDFGPWSGPFEFEMWKKTVLRRLSKRLPMSNEERQAMERDDDMYDLTPQPLPAPSTPRPTKAIGKAPDASFEFVTVDGKDLSFTTPADYLKAWGSACSAAKTMEDLDTLWNGNSARFNKLPDEIAQNCRDIWEEAAKATEQDPPAPKSKPKGKSEKKKPEPEPEPQAEPDESYDDPV
jgi:recombination protein RecT